MKEFVYAVYKKTKGLAKKHCPKTVTKKRSFPLHVRYILPCPFCASENVKLDQEAMSYGRELWNVVCLSCNAKGGHKYQKALRDFTDYNVQDFRRNPILRAKVEDEYNEYINDLKLEAVKVWNIRRWEHEQ
jgi:hypothetical protein